VVDKPAGIAVHKGPKGGPSFEDDFDALRFGLPRNPSLAHRLDRDTSGCLVLGRHRKALEKLGLLFKQGKISKTYWAIVETGPEDESGTIDLPLGKLDTTRGWWMKVDPDGLPSTTLYRVLGRTLVDGFRLAWMEFQPLTGRTHQLRVHSAALGWPILGDPIYGSSGPRDGGPPLHLHARAVKIPMSNNKPPIEVTAPVPEHMKERLAACGWMEEAARDQTGAAALLPEGEDGRETAR
ncbi:MAG: Pseudouridine synthase, partial [Hyphomicrobiales bacterium]|nr:Pseudouridine synthase [Hyphomicrobiales bacterium]